MWQHADGAVPEKAWQHRLKNHEINVKLGFARLWLAANDDGVHPHVYISNHHFGTKHPERGQILNRMKTK